MATSGGQPGNQNGVKGKLVYDALRKAAAEDDWRQLHAGSKKVMAAFARGEPWAVQFVAERFDGKVTQPVGGDEAAPFLHKVIVDLVRKDAG